MSVETIVWDNSTTRILKSYDILEDRFYYTLYMERQDIKEPIVITTPGPVGSTSKEQIDDLYRRLWFAAGVQFKVISKREDDERESSFNRSAEEVAEAVRKAWYKDGEWVTEE